MILARKSPRLGTTSANHTARATMSQEPVKRVFASLVTIAPLALFLSVSDRFMHLSLYPQRRETQRLRERFLSPQPYHIIPPFPNRYSKWYELSDLSSHMRRRIAGPGGLVFSALLGWAYPERDMGWLHRLLDDGQQLLTQGAHIHLGAQRGTKGCHDLSCIILATIETAINDGLEEATQRLEEGGNHQRGADEDQGLLGEAAGHGTHQGLQGEDEANIEPHQQDGQTAIHQRAVDDNVDVPHPIAQNRDPQAKGNERKE